MIVFASTRVSRSVILMFGEAPKNSRYAVSCSGLSFVVSMTSVSSSHEPRESPNQGWIASGNDGGAPVSSASPASRETPMGMMRVSWTISVMITTWDGVLHDGVVVVVEVVGEHGRPGVGPEGDDAALGEGPVLGVVVLAMPAAGREEPAEPLLRFGGARGDAAVVGHREEGAARLAVHDRDLIAAVEVEDVVAARATGRRVEHEVAAEADAAGRGRVAVGIAELRVGLDALLPAALDLGDLLGGEHGLEPLGTLDGGDRPVRPVPLQVRPPIGRARHPAAILSQGNGNRHRSDQGHGDGCSNRGYLHGNVPRSSASRRHESRHFLII